jgi:hemerythrin-like domain-containing protein
MMSLTDDLREQHAAILQLVGQMETTLTIDTLAANADTLIDTLSVLARKLAIHLAMEDRALYPLLIARGSGTVRQTTQAFVNEMGHIASVFKTYAATWKSAESIKGDPKTFCEETGAVFSALRERIQREEAELYPLADLV